MRAMDRSTVGACSLRIAETLGLHRGSVYRWLARFGHFRQGRPPVLEHPVQDLTDYDRAFGVDFTANTEG